jgi:hypothetical protein
MVSVDRGARLALALGLVALLGGAIGPLGPSPRADAALEALVGTYRNEAPDGGRATVEGATDAALGHARRLVRFFARPRILDNNPPFERLTITRVGTDVEVAYDDVRTYRAPLGGPPTKQRSPDGHEVEVTYTMQGTTLVERAAAGKGYALTSYRLDGDGLVMETRIESPRLPEPVRFEMRFRRG